MLSFQTFSHKGRFSKLLLESCWRAVIAGAASSALLFGQAFTGSISGLVTDSTGAVVTDVQITITDLERNVQFKTVSNEQGLYVVSQLPPGRYSVTAEMTGFRKFLLDAIPLSTQQKASVNITLELGAITESVQVTGQAQLIETQTSTLGTVTENKRIVDLPLNGRNVHTLVLLTPGVLGWVPTGGVGESYEAAGRYLVNGGRESSTAVQLDGVAVDLTSYIPGFSNYSAVPSVEGVQEFRIQTNAFSAESGRSGGGLVTMVTKSGTNEFHGSLYEFLRNSALDSNFFFNNAAGRPLGSFKRNEFGATVGGPIWLPKLYNGKDRTFFFAAYEGRRLRRGELFIHSLPTALEKQGDFSQTFNSAGQLRVIYNPFSTRPDPARPGQFLRDPFPGNRIPASMLDPIAWNAQTFYPEPNTPGLPFTRQQNYIVSGTEKDTNNRGTFKFDHLFNDRHRMFFRYTILNWEIARPEPWPAAPSGRLGVTSGNPGCPDPTCFDFYQRQQNAALDYTVTLSTQTLVNFRYGFGRGILDRGSRYLGYRPSNLGFPTYMEQGADLLVFPQFGVEEITPVGLQHHWNFRNSSNLHEVLGNVTRVAGRHTVKYGAELRFNFINHMQASWQAIFNFGRAGSQGPDPRVPTSTAGVGYASFLLGFGTGGNVVNGIRPAAHNRYAGLYIQDDFKATRKLTINLGLRWDIETGTTERYDRLSVFDPTVRSPLSDKVGMELFGGYLFPDKGLGRRSVHEADLKNFNPRIGLAYELNSNTAIRAGYGIFFGVPAYAGIFTGPMYNASTPWVTSLDGVTPFRFMSDPFPDGLNPQEGSSNGLLAAISQGVGAAFPPTMLAPYNQQWNLTIQRALAKDLALEVAYAGNKGTHLPLDWQINQLRPELLKPENNLLELVPNPFFGHIPTGTMAQPMVQRGQLLRPFPQYTGVTLSRPGWGNSNYHALQGKLERRFAGGTSAMLSYNFSKLISDGGDNVWASAGQRDFYCRACDRSLSVYDQTHRMVANFTYELPFGRGKPLGASWNKVADAILGQWQINGIAIIGSARPLQFGVVQNTSFSFGGGQRPDSTGRSADIPKDERTLERWFNTSEFVLPAPYTFGNVGRLHPSLRGDRVETLDFSVFKNFRIRERTQVQFRAEAFNVFNHPVFADPNTTVGNVNFGRVLGQANAPRQIQFGLKILF
jgi:Carboxypeptidase regulatory-like domain/TonB dependent receptor